MAENTYPISLEHNIYIVWNSEYDLGIPIIDEQHKGIVTIINSLHFGIQNHYAEDILAQIIDMMNNYTHIHFQTEERFLEKTGFPNAKKHIDIHRDLQLKLDKTGRNSILDKDPYLFMNFLKKWWINHICIEDLNFRDYFLSLKEGV